MQTIDLCDTVYLQSGDDITLETSESALTGMDNTVLVAAKVLKDFSGYPGGVRVRLRKRIPVSMGLGGGSSDAAAALIGLNSLWELMLSTAELMDVAARVGSDVPFFIVGGTALVEGRGERVIPLPSVGKLAIVVVAPKVTTPTAKTKRMYSLLTEAHYSDGQRTSKVSAAISRREVAPTYYNTFEQVALDAFPGLKEDWLTFVTVAGQDVHLCGSGPGLFTVVKTRSRARAIADGMHRLGYLAHAVSVMAECRVDVHGGSGGDLA